MTDSKPEAGRLGITMTGFNYTANSYPAHTKPHTSSAVPLHSAIEYMQGTK